MSPILQKTKRAMEKRIRKFKAFTELESSEELNRDVLVKFYLTDKIKEHTYHLRIERGSDEFTIFLPGPGSQITGKRKDLFSPGKLDTYDPGFVQNWIASCFDRLDNKISEGSHDSDEGLDTQQFKYEILPVQEGAIYQLAFDRNKNVVSIIFPQRFIQFAPDEIYLALPELPIIHSGVVNSMVRERLLEEGIELPPTPYLGGVEVSGNYDE